MTASYTAISSAGSTVDAMPSRTALAYHLQQWLGAMHKVNTPEDGEHHQACNSQLQGKAEG